jgi:hypothetical protein
MVRVALPATAHTAWHALSMPDRAPQTLAIQRLYFHTFDRVREILAADGDRPVQTLVHCYAGIDRSPSAGPCYLIDRGMSRTDAVRYVTDRTAASSTTIHDWADGVR